VKAYSQKYAFKFCTIFTAFMEKEAAFIEECFDDLGLRKTFWEELVTRVIGEHKERLI